MFARYDAGRLRDFVTGAFRFAGVSEADAELTARVLVAADLRGIDSHGVARLESFYLDPLLSGKIAARPPVRAVDETPVSLVLDGGNGLGPPNGERAMRTCIAKARDAGVAFATVRNTNHFGMAAYYPMLALAEDMIGIAMTTGGRTVVPTHGREVRLGTNPISVAVPAGRGQPFVLDMATSVVAYGKLQVAARLGRSIPAEWALDREGSPTTDPRSGMEGALLPLGGQGTQGGGHKGYGLSLLVEILSGVLAGAPFRRGAFEPDGPLHPPNVGHFFGVLRPDLFRPLAEFKPAMDECLDAMRTCPPAPGATRVQVAGAPEFETAEERGRQGIPLAPPVVESLQRVAAKTHISWLG
jgi:LDH2 family malate/lactate/ureidoglycolate dehydrogenase